MADSRKQNGTEIVKIQRSESRKTEKTDKTALKSPCSMGTWAFGA